MGLLVVSSPRNLFTRTDRIVDAHHALPLARVWGDADHTSSDGQFFTAARNSGEINAKYGPDPGLRIYSFLSGQYGSFHSSVIEATAGEAPYVLDGLMGNAAQFNPLVHCTDTGGVSEHVFARFHLLGLRLAPRLRGFPNRKLACFGRASQWKGLAPIMGKPINDDVILSHWDNEVIRLAPSARTGDIKPSAMLKKLEAYRQQNRLYLALGEIGRVERTLYMLDWMENPNKRARRYLPRDTPIAALSKRDMKAICERLNGTPRKCLGWQTPTEAFAEELRKLR